MRVATADRSKAWTAEDYLLLGEKTTPCQLINGELIMSPSPPPLHQMIVGNLYNLLRSATTKDQGIVFLSPIDLYIDKKNVFQPDLVYLSAGKKNIITERGIEGVPDLVVEVISPSNSYSDRYEKKNRYQQFGIAEYWIVDPANETLEIYAGANWEKPTLYLAGEGEVTSSVLLHLAFDLKIIFSF
jgi:Uma2 family endonuclease